MLKRNIKTNLGTSLIKALNDLKKENYTTDMLVIFTDGCYAIPNKEMFNPKTKYIFCITYPNNLSTHQNLPAHIIPITVEG